MKAIGKTKRARAAKRNLFRELREGISALADARQGKRTLRNHAVSTSSRQRLQRDEERRADTGVQGSAGER